MVPSIIVATASRMPALLLVEAAFASAAALLCVLLFRSKPPTLPSRAASQRVLLRARSMGAGSQALSVGQLWEDAKVRAPRWRMGVPRFAPASTAACPPRPTHLLCARCA